MNLYIESSKVLNLVKEKRSAIKTLVYTSQYENKKQLLALVCETLRYGNVLTQIIESLNLLKTERLLKNDASLAQALLYDFIIGKGLVRAGKLKQTMTRHKTDIHEELKKMLQDADVTSPAELLPEQDKDVHLPRYVRVNLIKTTVEAVIMRLEAEEWEYVISPATHMKRFRKIVKDLEKYQFTRDLHLPDLLVFPPGTDLHDNQLFLDGDIIFQDKASCFPAHILNPPEGAVVIDSCAAPGNKTSHLASLMKDHGKIFAFDKDGRRLAILQDLTKTAGVTCVMVKCQDFLKVNPDDPTYEDVEYMLVDPSCSGSGIVSRMNQFTDDDSSSATDRLESLSRFQTLILEQALRFPKVKKVVYSTCSIHTQENEDVVENVYEKVKDKFEFEVIMSDWPIRGEEGYEHAHCFVRMSPETSLTNGFFIACFKKLEIENDMMQDINNDEDECHDESLTSAESSKKNKKKSKKGIRQKGDNQEERNDENQNEHKKKMKKDRKSKSLDNDNKSDDDLKENETDEISAKKVKKKKKHKSKDTDLDNDNVKGTDLENNDDFVKKKYKKSKHSENAAINSESNGEESNECDEGNKKIKKHKRKHDDEDNDLSCDVHSKKKKHKHKKKE